MAAAASSTTATICISCQDRLGISSPTTSLLRTHRSQRLFSKVPVSQIMMRRSFVIRVSAVGDTPLPETATDAADPESSVETAKVPYSLISAINVEKALRGIAITDADHYGRLGIQRGCSYNQVTGAYKTKCDELMSQGLEEEELKEKMELLKESYYILSSEEERRLYDWSLVRSQKPDRYVWPFEVDITQTSTETPPQQEPEDVGPTVLLGYFLLGWLVLSFTLSIVLNR